MPKEITHCILAEKSAFAMASSRNRHKQTIGREIYFLFEKHPELLFFGSISPDIFFYDIAMPWEFRVRHRGGLWGDLVHGTDGENSLAHVFEMFDILRSGELQQQITPGRILTHEERGALTLFVLGYLSHVALDTVMHPLVYYYSGNYYAHEIMEKLRSESRHRAIETVLDLYNLARIDSDLRRYKALKKMTLPARWRDLVLSLYTLALTRAWPEHTHREFGDLPAALPAREHPLFKVALRGYKKEIFFNRIFQNPRLARLGLWYNRKKNDALRAHSSLLYPAQSYQEYLDLEGGNLFRLTGLTSYRDPVNDRPKKIDATRLNMKCVARTQAFYRVGWLYVSGQISRTKAEMTLKGYSLNHGRVALRTDAMRHFAPLPINGNFEYIEETRVGSKG